MKPQLDGQPARLLSRGQKEAFPEHFNRIRALRNGGQPTPLRSRFGRKRCGSFPCFCFFSRDVETRLASPSLVNVHAGVIECEERLGPR